jgi:hypothetical protein
MKRPPGGNLSGQFKRHRRTTDVSINIPPLDILQEAGDALDHAEATDPALRPRGRCGGFAVRRPTPFERLSGGNLFWVVPRHSAVRAYWRALKTAMGQHVYVEDTLRVCRRKFKLAWNAYDDLTIARDSGAFLEHPTLRAILDARAVLVESYTILEQVEASAAYMRQIKANKRAAVSLRKFKRHYPETYALKKTRERRR